LSGTLYVVGTPIGNLGDITLRALETLKAVDGIACEDTRQTLKLLVRYGFHKPLYTIFGPKEKRETPRILRLLEGGKSVALVTDAGTPGISDPGNFLVSQARAQGVRIEPIPGASAAAALVSISGVSQDGFIFLGFLPRKLGKIKRELKSASQLERAVVFYESPYRTHATLAAAQEVFGADAFCLVGRELTKKFEETLAGPLSQVIRELEGREILGEVSILIKPS